MITKLITMEVAKTVQTNQSTELQQWNQLSARLPKLRTRLEQLESRPTTLLICLRGRKNPLRNDQPEAAAVQVAALLSELAKEYGARDEDTEAAISEAATNIVQRFGFMGIHEIREAYRQWANEEIKVSGAEMYGGKFSARQVGMILSAYNERRRKLIAAYEDEKNEMTFRKEQEAKARRAAKQFETEFFYQIIRARAQGRRWQDVPDGWYDFATARGWIAVTDEEKAEAWKRSAVELEREKDEERRAAMAGDKMFRITALKAIGAKDDKVRRISISKKLLTHRKLITG